MRLRLIPLFGLVTWSLASVAAETGPVPEAESRQLIEEAQQNGARRTVLRLRSNQREWARVIENVASGQRSWIDVALSLKAGTDAAAGTESRDALFRALQRNPAYVLEHAQVGGYPLVVLCLGRAHPLPTYHEAIAEVEAAKKALMKVDAKELRAKKELCLAQLQEGRAALRNFF